MRSCEIYTFYFCNLSLCWQICFIGDHHFHAFFNCAVHVHLPHPNVGQRLKGLSSGDVIDENNALSAPVIRCRGKKIEKNEAVSDNNNNNEKRELLVVICAMMNTNSQLVKVLKRSWPAVSQIVSLMVFPPIVTTFALKSTPARTERSNWCTAYYKGIITMKFWPIVGESSSKSPVENRNRRELLPTPLSPTRRICRQ